MHGFLIGLGAAAPALRAAAPAVFPGAAVTSAGDRILIAASDGALPLQPSADGTVRAGVFGYLLPSPTTPADAVAARGTAAALRALPGGGFAFVAVNEAAGSCGIATDRFGSVPIYLARIADGAFLSSNPVLLTRCPGVDLTPDLVAMAEWIEIGHTVGDRHLVRGIRLLPLGTLCTWDGRELTTEAYDTSLRDAPASGRGDPRTFTALMEEACARHAAVDPRPAQLQSAGLDSRFLLACWPAGYDPVCYMYGDPSAIEPSIAAAVAAVRGSRTAHHFATPDEVAAGLDDIFEATGAIVFPDRLFIGRQIAADGHASVLDGFLGDALAGGLFHTAARHFDGPDRVRARLGAWVDRRFRDVGVDRLTRWMHAEIRERLADDVVAYLDQDFVATIAAQRDAMLEDIAVELERSRHPGESVALTWRTFRIRNRSAHSILLQAALCRESVRVFTPFTADSALVDWLLGLHPRETRGKRLYLRTFRSARPAYAAVPWGLSLLPLSRPALQHRISAAAIGRGFGIPGVTGDAQGRRRDPNGWAHWLRHGAALRSAAQERLGAAGILRRDTGYFADLAAGRVRGSGKLFHAAAVARWLTIGGRDS